MNDHRRVKWRNFPIEELRERFPAFVENVEPGGRFVDPHCPIGDPTRSRRVSVVIVNHFVHDLVAQDHHLGNGAVAFDVSDVACVHDADVGAHFHTEAEHEQLPLHVGSDGEFHDAEPALQDAQVSSLVELLAA